MRLSCQIKTLLKLTKKEATVVQLRYFIHHLLFDTTPPVGGDQGPSPKAVMLSTILGCSGMDVAGLLRKYRMQPSRFHMTADATPRAEHPKIFPRIDVTFEIDGEGLDHAKIIEAVGLSMTRYCGVSAMIAPTSPIHYQVLVNGRKISEGVAQFAE